VLAAGRRLARAGFRIILYRSPGRPLPRSVDGPWDWPAIERARRIRARAPAALTVAPAWGLSAAPSRPGPLGRGGAWEVEAREVEAAYGEGSTLHVSLEEFARTLTPAREDRERFREGGVRSRAIADRMRASAGSGERRQLRGAFERYRAFDRPNVLHLFATMRRDPGFARAFPAAVQTGPLWPYARSLPRRRRPPEWVWYASPASSEAIAEDVAAGLSRARRPPRLAIRHDRAWSRTSERTNVEHLVGPVPSADWRDRFAAADVRIATGSRTLLEAIELGGPFLYFNGVLGQGSARRRHRPEKLQELLVALRRQRAPPDLVRDLADFGAGRRVSAVVRRAADRTGGWSRFPRRVRSTGFRPPYDDAGRLLIAVARRLAARPQDAREIVLRARSGRPI
jgi:hypothetical protein